MSSILSIKKEVLQGISGLKRDLPLEKYLLGKTQYIDEEEVKNLGCEYVPLTFGTTVRSMYSNRVVYYKVDSHTNRYYDVIGNIEAPMIHKGYDLVMFLSSISAQRMVETKAMRDNILSEVMAKESMFTVRGIYVMYSVPMICPMVYSQIVLKDKGFEIFETLLNKKYGTCSIDEMRKSPQGNIRYVLDDIIMLRKEG